MSTRLASLIATVGLAAGMLPAADKALLRPHWESGKIYTLENALNFSTTIPNLGENGKQSTSVTQTLSISVKPEGDTRLATIKIGGVIAQMKTMGQTMTYDSADPAKSPATLQQAFGAVVGREFILVYDKDEKITTVRGMENLAAPHVAGAKGPSPTQFVDAFRKGEELGMPKDPVAPGDTWTFDDTVEMPPVGTMVIKGTGKYDSIVDLDGRKHAKILIEGTFSTPETAPGSTPPMMKFGEGSKVKIEKLFDLDRRATSRSIMTSDLKISINGQDVPMSQEVTTKLLKIEDAK